MNVFQMQCRMGNQKNASKPLFCLLVIGHADCFLLYFYKCRQYECSRPAAWNAHNLCECQHSASWSLRSFGIGMVQERTKVVDVKGYRFFPTTLFYRSNVGARVIHILSITVSSYPGLINGFLYPHWNGSLCGLWALLGSSRFWRSGHDRMMKKVDTAAGISNVLYMGLAVCGGMWMPLEIMPKMMQNIGHWLPSYHYGSGAWEIARGQMPNWKNILFLLAYSIVIILSLNI
uniref:ABC transporter transmembrane subunit n=1 Tax=Bacillus licheniformis TaxID=1402 RepID=Q9F5X4_BACLI|nr:ABC transporter transmembrane subunit [Bacillus licheniformis]